MGKRTPQLRERDQQNLVTVLASVDKLDGLKDSSAAAQLRQVLSVLEKPAQAQAVPLSTPPKRRRGPIL